MKRLPQSKNRDIVFQEAGREILIYDFSIDKAYCLNETLALVYKNCNGTTTFDEVKKKHSLTDDFIFLALDQLEQNNLLDGEKIKHFNHLSRREAIRRATLASVIALPLISPVLAPSAAAAASCQANGQACAPNNSQANCCASTSRCFNATCINCFGTGIVFVAAPTIGVCTNYPERNLCCNTTDAPSGGNGAACVCP